VGIRIELYFLALSQMKNAAVNPKPIEIVNENKMDSTAFKKLIVSTV